MKNFLNVLLLFVGFQLNLYSQITDLQLFKIMSGDLFIGIQPDQISWHPDNKSFYFKWDKDNSGIDTYYQFTLKDKKLIKLSPEQTLSLPVDGYFTDKLNKHFYFKKNGKLFKWTPTGSNVIYSAATDYQIVRVFENGNLRFRIDNNYFLFRLDVPSFEQETNFNSGYAPKESELDYLEKQQLELFEIEQKLEEKRQSSKIENEKYQREFENTIYLEEYYLEWAEFAKNKSRIIYSSTKYPKNESTDYASFVNSSGKTTLLKARSKVGAEDPKHKLITYNPTEKTSTPVDISGLSGIFDLPEYRLKIYNDTSKLQNPKNVIYHTHGFSESTGSLLVEVKSYDNKDRWITLLNESGELIEINHQHDEAWIGGPGISSWNMVPGNCGWIDESTLYYQSEATGYSHLYTYNLNTKKHTQLTAGNYEIHEAYLSLDRSKFYVSTNKTHPGNREFYSLSIKDKKLTPILTEDGNHEVFLSPDESQLAVRYSYKNKPWEIYSTANIENANLTQVTFSQTSEFKAYAWRAPEVITFKATDGQEVFARIYEPKAEVKNGAAVLFVHGAGYLQNAHNWWSGYHREYMFNNLLADLGYTVLDVDYRASQGYGSKFRTDIYRFMGGKDLSDHVDARQLLIDKHGIDPERIGIYGGSYGGFITLMALLTEPGKFKCGAAVRSVTDWAHYNHEYTSNILNTPEQDPEAFRKSSPIYFAENLEDHLLMLHGMVDDNVQYQDVVRLSQRFIELGKTNWDLVGYPIEPHGFVETSSWVDEYGRILKLFEEQLGPKK